MGRSWIRRPIGSIRSSWVVSADPAVSFRTAASTSTLRPVLRSELRSNNRHGLKGSEASPYNTCGSYRLSTCEAPGFCLFPACHGPYQDRLPLPCITTISESRSATERTISLSQNRVAHYAYWAVHDCGDRIKDEFWGAQIVRSVYECNPLAS